MSLETSNDKSIRAFIDKHKQLLLKEREAEIERTSLLLSNCAPSLLEQKGLALGNLGVVNVNIGLGGKTLVELERPTAFHNTPLFPPHNLRPGDLARIEDGVSNIINKKPAKGKKTVESSKTSKSVEGVVYKVSDVRIVLAVDPGDSSDDADLPDRCRVVKLANSVTYDRMEKALDMLEKIALPDSSSASDKNVPQMTSLIRVLLGISHPSDKLPIEDIKFFDTTLNASQQEAVKFALESPEVACIHGPPGTGKTHTLIEIIRQLTSTLDNNSKPLRVLVCGASNLSVDNILQRLLELPKTEGNTPLKVTRVGHPARVMAHEGILDSTLEVKAGRSDQAALARDVKNELEATMNVLSGKGKGAKGKAPRGLERKKMWEEVRALRKEYRQREGGVVQSVLSHSQIVLATCHSSGGWQLRNQEFDVVILDEATQALEAVCWIPIFKAKKLILAGDPMQLPPTILSVDQHRKSEKKALPSQKEQTQTAMKPPVTAKDIEPVIPESENSTVSDEESSSSKSETEDEEDEEPPAAVKAALNKTSKPRKLKKKQGLRPPRSLETTLFERLEKMYGPGIKRMLNVQYRMHAQIAAFPSKVMYYNKLTSHQSVAGHLLRDLPNVKASSEDEEKELLGTPVAFYDTAGCEYFERIDGDGDEGSKCNENEAMVVKRFIEELASVGVVPSQIAVITPYQAQVSLLTSLLRPTYGLELEIGTVDGMQGREKEAVIISLVRSNANREVGFLKDKRRLNVAMTRAKMHLCVVGDSSTVQHGSPFLKKWLTWLENNADVRYAGLE
ncbi:P-loop containing nucleoside triphosphate hydrolase protein [Irpex rosettiformis]|uniref:P-loop containing nucleoside triphosphate hydrolase protein n=1 Tax=Irpex rosettiformis TaxID=378272 RepID=A0ACB8U236_9APHY|nr:P-loop containing nucleoside triphosphate hydrolase protein [Irpex rosettiformis]